MTFIAVLLLDSIFSQNPLSMSVDIPSDLKCAVNAFRTITDHTE